MMFPAVSKLQAERNKQGEEMEVTLTPGQQEKLQSIAHCTGCSIGRVVEMVLDDYLFRVEARRQVVHEDVEGKPVES